MKRVYLGLGSNVGNRERMLRQAVARLAGPDLVIARTSPLYETEPMGLPDQPWFLNLVAEAETRLFPMQLLARIQRVETMLGRQRDIRNGPRTIDIDILFYGRFVIQSPQLVVPHPRMADRRFVLEPLADVAPDFRHPVLGRSVSELLSRVRGQQVRRLDVRERSAEEETV